jgi:hypothetical protein
VLGRTATGLAFLLGLGVAAVAPSPASGAVAADQSKYQSVPIVDWMSPGELLDGVGQWIYVAPIPPPGPTQVPPTGYVYGPSFVVADQVNGDDREGTVGLSTDDQGPIAGIQVNFTDAVTIRYDWSPGKFYFLFAHHVGGGDWGGWVFDHAASSWTFIGSTPSFPAGQKLRQYSGDVVRGAEGSTVPAFHRGGSSPVEGECSAFPRVDAYYYPMVAYRGSDFALSTLDLSRSSFGNCLTETTFEQGWAHFRVGSLPAGG